MKRPLDCGGADGAYVGALDAAGRAEGAAGHVRSADPARGVPGRQARGGADGQSAVAGAVEDLEHDEFLTDAEYKDAAQRGGVLKHELRLSNPMRQDFRGFEFEVPVQDR